jgi:hypothetical protein
VTGEIGPGTTAGTTAGTTTDAAGTPSGAGHTSLDVLAVPMSITVHGPYFKAVTFLKGLQSAERAFLVTGLQVTVDETGVSLAIRGQVFAVPRAADALAGATGAVAPAAGTAATGTPAVPLATGKDAAAIPPAPAPQPSR